MKSSESGKKTNRLNLPFIALSALVNIVLLAVVAGAGFLVVQIFFQGRLSTDWARYMVIAFFMAGILVTALVNRLYLRRKHRGKRLPDEKAKD
ncbi:MAG: hypothetical protein EHM28_14150 [Spirochaetaceae bacterium]|nr:MAG: hypothetical protein EHM28_14150 [Spirochaetaceae bacterium]